MTLPLFLDTTPELNRAFGAPGRVAFRAGKNGLPLLVLANRQASAEISLRGAQVLSYRPAGQPPVLWMSNAAVCEPGEPLNSGVPLSWPWFSTAEDPALPDHGFAFTSMWQLRSVEYGEDSSTAVFTLQDDETTRRLWPHAFRLTLRATVGASLALELATENPGDETLAIRQGFHTYFVVRDIEKTTLRGLENTPFYNKALRVMAPPSPDPITVREEIDRVYFPTTAACVLEDHGLGRRIVIEKSGSKSTVVWNPWEEKTRRMRGFEARDFRNFLCVETTNTREDVVLLPPRGSCALAATITSEMRV